MVKKTSHGLRRQVPETIILQRLRMPTSAVVAITGFVGKASALSSLCLRPEDIKADRYAYYDVSLRHISMILDIITQCFACPKSESLRNKCYRLCQRMYYQDCVRMRWALLASVSRCITQANGRGKHNKRHRESANEDLDEVLDRVWGFEWRHRGLNEY